jgi:hypothetical protein
MVKEDLITVKLWPILVELRSMISSHHSTNELLDDLRRLRTSKDFSDFEVICQTEKFSCHKKDLLAPLK